MDYFDDLVTRMLQVLNDMNMTVTIYGDPRIVRKITPTEYTYQAPASIGPAMAVALVTTFYGVILARLVCIPLATKMNARYDRTELKNNIQLDGLVLLAERKSPRYIQDKLNSFVDVKDQFLIDRDLNRETITGNAQA